jgi:hypothetical protein
MSPGRFSASQLRKPQIDDGSLDTLPEDGEDNMSNLVENRNRAQSLVKPMDQSLLRHPSGADTLSGSDKRKQFLEDFNGEHTAAHVISLIAAADLKRIDKLGLGQGKMQCQISPSCIYLG